MRRTLNVLFNGRDKFENGDVFAKREVLQSLGSNTILKDGKISINTYKWLEPIKNEYKNLESQFLEGSNSDLQIKNASNEAVRQQWRGARKAFRTYHLPRLYHDSDGYERARRIQ